MSGQEKRLEEKRVKYSGYSTEPDDYQSVDGAIAFASNATYEDGGIKGIPESVRGRLVVAEGAQIYIHHTVNYYHYIIIYQCEGCVRLYVIDKTNMEGYLNDEDDEHLYVDAIYHHHEEVDDDSEKDMPDNMTSDVVEHLYTCEGKFVDIQAVANTLVVSTDEDMYYLLCKPGGVEDGQEALTKWCEHPYIYLGNKVPSVEMQFALNEKVLAKEYSNVIFSKVQGANARGSATSGETTGYEQVANLDGTVNSKDEKIYFADNVTLLKGNSYRLRIVYSSQVATVSHLYLYGTNESGEADVLIFDTSVRSQYIGYNPQENYSNLYITITATSSYPCGITLWLERVTSSSLGTSQYYVQYSEENYEAVMGCINKFVATYGKGKNSFIHPFFVRYAVRLYDDSVCEVSPPILMMPNKGYAPFVWSDTTETNYNLTLYAFAAKLQYKLLNTLGENWRDIVQSVDIYVSQPVYPYDQGEGYDETDLKFTYKDYVTASGEERSEIEDLVYGYGTLTDMQDGTLEEYYAKNNLFDVISEQYSFGNQTESKYWRLTLVAPKTDTEIEKEICKVSSFYLIKKINFDDLERKEDFMELELDKGVLEGLEGREALSEDVIGYDRFMGVSLHSYNSRMHVYGGELVYRDLIHLERQNNYFNKQTNAIYRYRLYEAWVYIRTSSGTKVVHTTYDEDPHYCASNIWLFYPNNRAYKIVLHVKTLSLDEQQETERYIELPLSEHEFLNGAYFYLWADDGLSDEAMMALRVDDFSPDDENSIDNTSVYVSEVGNPFTFRNSTAVTVGSGQVLALSSAAQAMSQGQFGQYPLYVFTDEGVWALEVASDGTYSTSQPITRDVCTNVESITQLDSSVLFVTDRGIMELAGSKCLCISESIESEFGEFDLTELPYFCEIYVQYVQGVDAADEGYADAVKDFKAEMQKWAKTRFFDFIKECRILYDYVHQRIIVYNAKSSIGYNYSLKDKAWGLMFTNLRYTLNSYPEAYALSKIDDADYGTWCEPEKKASDEEHWELMDMSTYKGASDGGDEGDDDPDEETETMMFVTRPLKFDMPDIWKTVRTVVQRGYFQQSVKENHIVGTVLYGSPDLFNWYIVGQSLTKEKEGTAHLELTAGHVIDNELGSPYKYFRVMVVCRLNASESVYGLTALYERKDDNTLR